MFLVRRILRVYLLPYSNKASEIECGRIQGGFLEFANPHLRNIQIEETAR